MNWITLGLALVFTPLAIPFVAFYIAIRMVFNGAIIQLKEMGGEL